MSEQRGETSSENLSRRYPPVIILKLNARVSTAAWVEVKGIQVGESEELDKLYFLWKKKRFDLL